MKKKRTLIIVVSVTSVLALCGVPALAQAPVATDVTAADIREFIEELPKDSRPRATSGKSKGSASMASLMICFGRSSDR